MKKILVLMFTLISINVHAQEEQTKHMVMFGNSFNFGWNGSGSTADVDSKLGIKDYLLSEGNFNVNYAYTVAPQFQLGLDVAVQTETEEAKAKAGGKVKSEEMSRSFAVFGVFNFSENLKESFYLGAAVGKMWVDNEVKDTTGGSTSKSETEYDGNLFYIGFGKRFSLKSLGIENLTYSPSISFQHVELSGDLEDAGVNSISTVTLDVVKFDLLF